MSTSHYINPHRLFHGVWIPQWLEERPEVSEKAKKQPSGTSNFGASILLEEASTETLGEAAAERAKRLRDPSCAAEEGLFNSWARPADIVPRATSFSCCCLEILDVAKTRHHRSENLTRNRRAEPQQLPERFLRKND